MQKKYEISVLIASYHPDEKKLYRTLKSILLQENAEIQIVVADDGSESDCFDKIRQFFLKHQFEDYILVKNKENRGTVLNYISGLKVCLGDYVKLISPGDYLNGAMCLRMWMDYMDEHHFAATCSEAVYYSLDENGMEKPAVSLAHPQRKNLQGEELKRNYLLYNDPFLGAATLCRTDILKQYMEMISGKVKYVEDNVYRLMLCKDENIGYYDKEAVLYETSSGISTGGSPKWAERIRRDNMAAEHIMVSLLDEDDPVRKQLACNIAYAGSSGVRHVWWKLIRYIRIKGLLSFVMEKRNNPRMTPDTIPTEWIGLLKKD